MNVHMRRRFVRPGLLEVLMIGGLYFAGELCRGLAGGGEEAGGRLAGRWTGTPGG